MIAKVVIALSLLLHTVYSSSRSFSVDWEHKTFLKDGQPFRYVSGSFHFTRVPNQYWEDRLMKMKAGGLNAVETYFLWNFHSQIEGQYDFEGDRDVEKFLRLANDTGLLVIARGFPFACAEWEFGGFPWYLKRTDDFTLRSSDPKFLAYVDDWLSQILPKLEPFLYKNGGPVITVQYENEYGTYFPGCDQVYLQHLVDKIKEYLGSDVVLFTTDRAYTRRALKCGSVKSELATVDFKVTSYPQFYFDVLRRYQPNAPLVNSEFYTGWLNHWGKPFQLVSAADLSDSLDEVLSLNASVNFYMYTGGTNFAYWAGANFGRPSNTYDLTTYDYDAPISESGDTTWKYYVIRDTIAKYFQTLTENPPPNSTKTSLADVKLTLKGSLVDFLDIVTKNNTFIESKYPKNMEDLGFDYGFVMYRVQLSRNYQGRLDLSFAINGLGDRASILVTKSKNDSTGAVFLGTIDNNHYLHPKLVVDGVSLESGDFLAIVVENRGRVNWGPHMNDQHKGIRGNVSLNGEMLQNWETAHLMLENLGSNFINTTKVTESSDFPLPLVYQAEVDMDLYDSFLNTTSFGRGVALVNEFNLGRYWPTMGPQQTLFFPKAVRNSTFILTLVEFEMKSKDGRVDFLDYPILDSI